MGQIYTVENELITHMEEFANEVKRKLKLKLVNCKRLWEFILLQSLFCESRNSWFPTYKTVQIPITHCDIL